MLGKFTLTSQTRHKDSQCSLPALHPAPSTRVQKYEKMLAPSGDFTQNNGGWNTSAGLDFSLRSMGYDNNGNITKMNQMGVKLSTSSLIDSLLYSYNTTSNKLNYVTDRVNDTTAHLGDFTEINNNTTQDYLYDGNGNLNRDNNKNITSITYNHLNLPAVITVTGKGTITYTYDAAGNKLNKTTVDLTVTPNKTTRTDYVSGFVYQNDTLQFMGHEEGRIRPRRANYSDTMYYDYFEKDHLGNTRIVLTDERQQDTYPAATVENAAASMATESNYYAINLADTISTGRIASWATTTGNNYPNNNGNPPYNNNPNSNTTATSAIVYKLNGNTGDKTGLGITLRVMSGDVVDVFGKSFYHLNVSQTPTNTYPITAALSSFINAFAGTPSIAGAAKGATGAALNASVPTTTGLTNWLGNVPNPGGVPKAYINWILFDEQFKPVAGGSGFDLVSATADAIKLHHGIVNIARNGYLYVYCSNESNIDVFFDNFQVIHTRGPLISDNHFMPTVLAISGISSKAAGKQSNKYKFGSKELQSQEFSDGSGLEEYDYGARLLDPQLGVWHSIDTMTEKMDRWSPYNYVFDNPINFIDSDGMEAVGADGLTNSQWVESSRMGADKDAANGFKEENKINGQKQKSISEYWSNFTASAFGGADGGPSGTIIDKYGKIISDAIMDVKGVFLKSEIFEQYRFLGNIGGVINADVIFGNVLDSHVDAVRNGLTLTTMKFRELEKGGGLWDIKDLPRTIWSLVHNLEMNKKITTLFSFRDNEMRAQDAGNFHYGVLGKMFGMSELLLLKAAGVAQMQDGHSRQEWQTPEMLKKYYGDDPVDQAWIKKGFKYFNKFYNY